MPRLSKMLNCILAASEACLPDVATRRQILDDLYCYLVGTLWLSSGCLGAPGTVTLANLYGGMMPASERCWPAMPPIVAAGARARLRLLKPTGPHGNSFIVQCDLLNTPFGNPG